MTSTEPTESTGCDGGSDAASQAPVPTVRGRLRYLLVLSRPRFWFYLAGPVIVGVAYGADAVPELFGPAALVLFGYFLVPANVLLYGVNDLFDADIDAENPKKAAEDGRESRWRGDRVVTAAIVAAGLLSLVTLAVTPPIAWPYLGGFLLLAVGYSAPPARLKTTPLLDSVSNGLYVLPGAAAYVAVSGTYPPTAALVSAWVWAMAMHTFSAVPDIKPDRAAGIRTTATVLGERRTYMYCAGCWALAAAAFATVDPGLGALLGVYPIFVVAVAATDVAVERAYWWFPALNTVVGTALTIGGLTRIVRPADAGLPIEVWALVVEVWALVVEVWALVGVIVGVA
ncbi:4-hydroxybenzoate polyprenyltransferase [Halopenitus malekzadehii]|uniref:4-hydroxybenzoate polyprenyltransferase n=1 Tax=Halopenitus malekzadehii TaxID=1267564 RepID=A0A1H6IRI1_9EURY|nr:prenyltransferase [Halopenitus malekzadehii]SEH51791.1 4-hydroxybenzoate polyprenyltransferase [Halopenitus malekzadehii]